MTKFGSVHTKLWAVQHNQKVSFLPTVLQILTSNIRSVDVDFLLRHDSIVIRVSVVKVAQEVVNISMRLLFAKAFHFFTSQLAVYVMIGRIPRRPCSAGSPIRSVKRIRRPCNIDKTTNPNK